MTHDELLARISELSLIDDLDMTEEYLSVEALRAVVELHKESTEWKDIPAGICLEDGERYPCPTIQAIEKELK